MFATCRQRQRRRLRLRPRDRCAGERCCLTSRSGVCSEAWGCLATGQAGRRGFELRGHCGLQTCMWKGRQAYGHGGQDGKRTFSAGQRAGGAEDLRTTRQVRRVGGKIQWASRHREQAGTAGGQLRRAVRMHSARRRGCALGLAFYPHYPYLANERSVHAHWHVLSNANDPHPRFAALDSLLVASHAWHAKPETSSRVTCEYPAGGQLKCPAERPSWGPGATQPSPPGVFGGYQLATPSGTHSQPRWRCTAKRTKVDLKSDPLQTWSINHKIHGQFILYSSASDEWRPDSEVTNVARSQNRR
ncbi:hypothetical protein GGX14DRAFT_393439 [Mycena pura]|uniref:Uncharacterized protein n=1 Tax=Mycena pura TaxID=153505 RepID=A0AAD6VHW9_9AGAR|nr:hypothetical protein GGX14DRAFT_393439 [Mycena pura]